MKSDSFDSLVWFFIQTQSNCFPSENMNIFSFILYKRWTASGFGLGQSAFSSISRHCGRFTELSLLRGATQWLSGELMNHLSWILSTACQLPDGCNKTQKHKDAVLDHITAIALQNKTQVEDVNVLLESTPSEVVWHKHQSGYSKNIFYLEMIIFKKSSDICQ